ncbi:alpha-2Db adrenergic receptor-like [Lytechinus variegatus]|uniref:alpha-2Db adrenergic receptor-like n=1 Tax=Lytechinus variegatus TaxID=7654 RepID=UPI001BB1727A|nr:alpha-2Db adrenergic receptor-like [Lytechinus variegatus]
MPFYDYSSYDEGIEQDTITVCNMTFNIEPGEYILHDYAPRVILALLVLAIFLVGTLGNLFVIAAVIFSKRLQTTTNVFIVNLAVSDFLTALFLPVHASTLLSKSSCYIPDLLCKFVAAATLTTLGCSVVTLAAIAFHRFTVLYGIMKPKPKFNDAFSTRNILIMVLFTWLYPIVLMVIILPLDVGSLGYALQYKVCAQNTENDNSDFLTLAVCLLVQFPAFVVIIVCYINIFKMLRRHQREMNAIMTPVMNEKSEVRITITEDSSKEKSDAASIGIVNPGFDESDGFKSAPAADQEVLKEPSDADHYGNSQPGNGEHSMIPCEPTDQDSSRFRKIPPSGRTENNACDNLTTEQQKVRFKQQRKLTINIFIIICVYTLCVMPPAVIYLIPTSDPAVPWFTILFLCNVCVNPIIYALKHPTFREVLICMVKCKYIDIPEQSSFLINLRYSLSNRKN